MYARDEDWIETRGSSEDRHCATQMMKFYYDKLKDAHLPALEFDDHNNSPHGADDDHKGPKYLAYPCPHVRTLYIASNPANRTMSVNV